MMQVQLPGINERLQQSLQLAERFWLHLHSYVASWTTLFELPLRVPVAPDADTIHLSLLYPLPLPKPPVLSPLWLCCGFGQLLVAGGSLGSAQSFQNPTCVFQCMQCSGCYCYQGLIFVEKREKNTEKSTLVGSKNARE